MAFRRAILPIAALALGLAAPLAAQELHFGLQGSGAVAFGDLHETTGKRLGFSGGLDLSLDFSNGNTLRTRFDATRFSGASVSTDANAFLVEYADYVHDKVEGAYLIAGLGWQNTRIRPSASPSQSLSALAFDAGLGWQYSDLLAVEARYVSSRPHPEGSTSRFRADHLDLGLVLRF